MDWKEYQYTSEFSLKNGIIHRPMVTIDILNGEKLLNCFSLIDSGTDSTLINADYMDLLGIDSSKCKKVIIGGVGESKSFGFIEKIKFKIEGFEQIFQTDAIFVKNLVTSGILGQKDIFENFKIRFEKKHRKFY